MSEVVVSVLTMHLLRHVHKDDVISDSCSVIIHWRVPVYSLTATLSVAVGIRVDCKFIGEEGGPVHNNLIARIHTLCFQNTDGTIYSGEFYL